VAFSTRIGRREMLYLLADMTDEERDRTIRRYCAAAGISVRAKKE